VRDNASVILSAAKDLGRQVRLDEILRCAQDDGWHVDRCTVTVEGVGP